MSLTIAEGVGQIRGYPSKKERIFCSRSTKRLSGDRSAPLTFIRGGLPFIQSIDQRLNHPSHELLNGVDQRWLSTSINAADWC